MSWLETALAAIEHLVKHGINWASLGGVLLLFLRNRSLKRRINRMLPRRLQDRSEDKLDAANGKLDAIMKHMGVSEWNAPISSPTDAPSRPAGGAGSTFFWAAKSRARLARQYMISNLRRIPMTKFLQKIASRKFWALIAALVTSNLLLFGVDSATAEKVAAIIGQIGAVVVYLLVEGGIDKEAQKQQVYIMPGSAPEPTEGGAYDGNSQSEIADQPRV